MRMMRMMMRRVRGRGIRRWIRGVKCWMGVAAGE